MGRGKYEDLTGTWFDKIEVLNRAPRERGGHPKWVCRCECGNIFIAQARYLKSGKTKSCGCLKKGKPANEMSIRDMWKNSESLDALDMENEEPYQNLANAIIAVAADDYRAALKENNEKLKASLEKFFHSNWYKTLTNVDGDSLIALLQKEHTAALAAANT